MTTNVTTLYPGLDGDTPVPALVGAPKPRTIDPAVRGWNDALAGKSALEAPKVIRNDPTAYTVYLYFHFEAYGAASRKSPFDPIPPNPLA